MYVYDDDEDWRDIPHFPGYKVSNRGKIYSVKVDRILHLARTNGKNSIKIYRDDGHKETKMVDRLVAQAFLPNPHGTRNVWLRHLDGDPLNDDVDNLEWANHPRTDL